MASPALPASRPRLAGPSPWRERLPALLLSLAALALIAVGALVERAAGALPQPASDDEILERVPPRQRDRQLGQLASWRASLARAPADAEAAARVARLAIETARRRSDPRYLGQAEAALAPWWTSATPPEEIQLLRATIRQARHDFPGALADLDALIDRAPEHAQALLTRAVVLTVLGRHGQAAASCQALPAAADPLTRAACAAPAVVADAQASPAQAARALASLREAIAGAAPAEAVWGTSVLGELAFWAGRLAEAEGHLARALRANPHDAYTRGCYADLLLDAGRFDEAVALLQGPEREQDDGLLLRLALAEHGRGGPRAAALKGELAARFAGARRRQDVTHRREEARFTLALGGDPARALELALSNWQVQREPWDARLVLASARAAGQPEKAAAVARFVADRGASWTAVSEGAR